MESLRLFVKQKRKELKLTQEDLALNAGVGLRFVRDLEQGKTTLRLDKVNDVLALFDEEAILDLMIEKRLGVEVVKEIDLYEEAFDTIFDVM